MDYVVYIPRMCTITIQVASLLSSPIYYSHKQLPLGKIRVVHVVV